MITADRLANTSNLIKKVIMNYEDPSKIVIANTSGNVNKDITIHLKNNNDIYSKMKDIKAGNNADNAFSDIVSSVPYTSNLENYTVINDKPINLGKVQAIRREYFKKLKDMEKCPASLREISTKIQYLNELPTDIIQKNIIIQEEMFKTISAGISNWISFFLCCPYRPLW